MSDSLKESARLQSFLCKNGARKYYRFRKSQFYGGIASADCIGCMLDCVFCWSQKPRKNLEHSGSFYTPNQVAKKLIAIAHNNNYSQVRITGNEPTLCKNHLLKILNLIPTHLLFILETNGILIDEDYAKSLSSFPNIHVRVSLKGATPALFSQITNVSPKYFDFQIRAIKMLLKYNISCHPSIMRDFLNKDNVKDLCRILESSNSVLVKNLEFETLIYYPFMDRALGKKVTSNQE